MFSTLRFTLLIPLAALMGCGVRPSPAPTAPQFQNWVVSLAGTFTDPQVFGFVGALHFSEGSISGTLTPQAPPNFTDLFPFYTCATFAPTAVTGSIDANNNLTLSLPVGGGTATITAIIGSNPEVPATGSYQVIGGTCAMPPTSMTITEYAPVSGTYAGTFNSLINNGASLVTAVLTQSDIPDSNGAFPLSGAVTVTGQCNTSFAVNSSYSWVAGPVTNALSGAPTSAGQVGDVGGRNSPDASTIAQAGFGEGAQPNNVCNGVYGGTLTRQ